MSIYNQFGFLMNKSQAKEITSSSIVCRSVAMPSVCSEEQSSVLMQCDPHSDKKVGRNMDVTSRLEVTHMIPSQLLVFSVPNAQ